MIVYFLLNFKKQQTICQLYQFEKMDFDLPLFFYINRIIKTITKNFQKIYKFLLTKQFFCIIMTE